MRRSPARRPGDELEEILPGLDLAVFGVDVIIGAGIIVLTRVVARTAASRAP